MRVYIGYSDSLIGDFLGALPAVMTMAEQHEVYFQIDASKKELFHLWKRPLSLNLVDSAVGHYDRRITLETQQAFDFSVLNKLYMTQSYQHQLGLPTPPFPIRLRPDVPSLIVPSYDYVVSPYARSLPDDEKWEAHNWDALFRLMPDKKFCVIGDSSYDIPISSQPNVNHFFNESFETVANLYRKSKGGLISVVTGTSHLAFHLSTKTHLLTNQQMEWGNNPDAFHITKKIPQLTPEQLKQILLP